MPQGYVYDLRWQTDRPYDSATVRAESRQAISIVKKYGGADRVNYVNHDETVPLTTKLRIVSLNKADIEAAQMWLQTVILKEVTLEMIQEPEVEQKESALDALKKKLGLK